MAVTTTKKDDGGWYRHSGAGQTARGLGLFSIGLGLAEVLMPRLMARATGMQGHDTLVRLFGLREIATGLGILKSKNPTPWIWGRVAGDTLDLAALGTRLRPDNPDVIATSIAFAAVAGVASADLACARRLTQGPIVATRDYGDRSGFTRPALDMTGAALDTFVMPRDFATPELLAPYGAKRSAPSPSKAPADARQGGGVRPASR